MSTNISEIVCLIRPLTGDTDSEVRQYSDADIRAYITVVAPTLPFSVTVIDSITIAEDLSSAEISRIALECSLLMISSELQEFSYKTPALAVKRKREKADARLQVIRDMLARLEDPAVSWDDEINKILDDCDRYMDALLGGSDA